MNKKNNKKSEKQTTEQKSKSKMVLFREKYPNGYAGGCNIVNMQAVLR